MSAKFRLERVADSVVSAGLAGGSMREKLAEVAEASDLTDHEIDRVVELANRGMHIKLSAMDIDRRFKFDLLDPKDFHAAPQRKAAATTTSILRDIGGDPFAPPPRHAVKVAEHAVSDIQACEDSIRACKELQVKLTEAAEDLLKLKRAALEEEMCIYTSAQSSRERAVRAAAGLLMGGVTFPSLYEALALAVSGSGATDEDRSLTDAFALDVLENLKEHGVKNRYLGFRRFISPNDIDKLTPGAILALTRRALGMKPGNAVQVDEVKMAQRYIETYGGVAKDSGDDDDSSPTRLPEEANRFLQTRESQRPVYLDEDMPVLPRPVIVDGDNEFVIAVKDLAGSRDRWWKAQGALSAIDRRLEEISRVLPGVRAAEQEWFAKKATPLLAVVPSALNLLGTAATAASLLPKGQPKPKDPAKRNQPPQTWAGGGGI